MADVDDEVLEELDVFLNLPGTGTNTMLLRCPESLIPTETEEMQCKTGRIKPGHRVEFDIELPKTTSNEHFDSSKSRNLATATENARKSFEDGECSKVTLGTNLQSTSAMTNALLNFSVGFVEKGSLYLTPIQYTGTLGPSFSYMDAAGESTQPSQKSAKKSGNEVGELSQDEGTSEQQNNPQPIRARFTRVESAEARQRRMATYEYFARRQGSYPWIPFTCHSSKDAVTETQKSALITPKGDTQSLPRISTDKLARNLLPSPDSPFVGKQPEISMNMIRALPPCEQIRALLKNVKVLQYQQVVPLWPRNLPATQLVHTLEQYATLVQGCWVVKSEELYPPTSSSAVSGVPAENLINGRDYVLWCFTQSRWQMRKDIVPIIKLPIDDVKIILEQLSRPTARRGWEFLLPYDHDFVSHHHDVAQRQTAAWTARFEALQSLYTIPRDWERRARAAAEAAAVSSHHSPPKRKRSKSRSSISIP